MTRPFLLGLTGSMGAGKSTVAGMFRDAGIPVWDADATVHAIYAKGGKGAVLIGAMRPQAVRGGSVNRAELKTWIAEDPEALRKIEKAVHPLVAANRNRFLAQETARGAGLVVFDVPLLYEIGAEAEVDAVLVVTAPEELRRERVMAREGAKEGDFERLTSRQMPDSEKRKRADFVIESILPAPTRREVLALIDRIANLSTHARNRSRH
jgi:dephospho-CoA kinase